MVSRIVPVNYGQTVNSFLRKKAIAHRAKPNPDYVIMDVDLKSSYSTILLGLYPVERLAIRKATKTEGLWDYIEKEFKKSGRETLFNKQAV